MFPAAEWKLAFEAALAWDVEMACPPAVSDHPNDENRGQKPEICRPEDAVPGVTKNYRGQGEAYGKPEGKPRQYLKRVPLVVNLDRRGDIGDGANCESLPRLHVYRPDGERDTAQNDPRVHASASETEG